MSLFPYAPFDLSVLPIYVTRVPAAPFARSYPRHFTFYVANPISSIASRQHCKHLPEMIPRFETRSSPNLLVATLAHSLLPSSLYLLCRFSQSSIQVGNQHLLSQVFYWWCSGNEQNVRRSWGSPANAIAHWPKSRPPNCGRRSRHYSALNHAS